MKLSSIKPKFQTALYSALSIIAMWLCWFIASRVAKNEFFFPPFRSVLKEFFALFTQTFFYRSVAKTLLRVLYAFAVSLAIASLIAFVATLCKGVAVFFRPIVSVLRTLPTMAILLMLLVWFTPGQAPVVIAVLVLFPLIYAQITASFAQIDGELLQMATVYRVSKWHKFRHIVLPQVTKYLLPQIGSDLSFGIKLVISAEVMANTFVSLGGMMQSSAIYMQVATLSALTLVSILLGLVVEYAFVLVTKLVFKRYHYAEVAV